jgi:hypothetical protein
MTSGATLDTSSGALVVDLEHGTDKTNNGAGAVTLTGITASAFTLPAGTTLDISVKGTNPGDGIVAGTYTQLAMNGTIDLNNATLLVASGNAATAGETFTIVQSGGGVNGTFNGLPEGALVVASDGSEFTISYRGHSGKAVVLTALGTKSNPPTGPGTNPPPGSTGGGTPGTNPPPPLVTVDRMQLVYSARGRVAEILVGFSGDVDASEAQRLTTYRLVKAGKRGSFTARNARTIKIRSAIYSGANDTVALTLAAPFSPTRPVQITVYGTGPSALQDSSGRPIDGNHDGQAGGDAVATVTRGGAILQAVTPAAGLVDVVLSRGMLSGPARPRTRSTPESPSGPVIPSSRDGLIPAGRRPPSVSRG